MDGSSRITELSSAITLSDGDPACGETSASLTQSRDGMWMTSSATLNLTAFLIIKIIFILLLFYLLFFFIKLPKKKLYGFKVFR